MIDAMLESKLKEELSRKPGHLTWRLHQRGWRIFSELAAEYDITPVQEAVLLVLSRLPGIDQKTLSGLVALDRSTAGNVLMRLEERKLLTRKADAKDKRARLLRLTPYGEELSKKLRPIAREAAEETLSTLTETERAEFGRLLRKLAAFHEPPDLARMPVATGNRLTGKNVVLVGLPRELGRMISEATTGEGASVSERDYPRHAAQEAAWQKLIDRISAGSESSHRIDILVLGAGAEVESGKTDGEKQSVAARGLGLTVAARSMAAQGYGRIINVGSFYFQDRSAATMAEEVVGSDALIAAMAAQLAVHPQYSRIAINTINPRQISQPIGTAARLPSVADVAGVVLFLAADNASRHMTGQTLQIGP